MLVSLAEQVHHSGEGGSSGGLAGLGGGVGRRSGTGVPLKAPASCQPALPGTTPLLRPLQSKKIKSIDCTIHRRQPQRSSAAAAGNCGRLLKATEAAELAPQREPYRPRVASASSSFRSTCADVAAS